MRHASKSDPFYSGKQCNKWEYFRNKTRQQIRLWMKMVTEDTWWCSYCKHRVMTLVRPDYDATWTKKGYINIFCSKCKEIETETRDKWSRISANDEMNFVHHENQAFCAWNNHPEIGKGTSRNEKYQPECVPMRYRMIGRRRACIKPEPAWSCNDILCIVLTLN